MIEQFTNSSHGPDVAANDTVNTLINNNPEEVFGVAYHTKISGLASDPMYLDNVGDVNARNLFYSIPTIPWTTVDGNDYSANTSTAPYDQDQLDLLLLEDAKFDVRISQTVAGSQLTMQTEVEYLDDGSPYALPLTLRIAVVEREITSLTGANGETEFEWVMKKLVNDNPGTTISTTWTAGMIETIHDTLDLSGLNIYDMSKLGVVAFIQNDVTGEVLQSGYDGYNPITGIEPPGAGTAPAADVLLYPNPAKEMVNVILPGNRIDKVSLYNMLGQEVMQLEPNLESVEIRTDGLSGGSYLVRVQSGDRVIVKRLSVIE